MTTAAARGLTTSRRCRSTKPDPAQESLEAVVHAGHCVSVIALMAIHEAATGIASPRGERPSPARRLLQQAEIKRVRTLAGRKTGTRSCS